MSRFTRSRCGTGLLFPLLLFMCSMAYFMQSRNPGWHFTLALPDEDCTCCKPTPPNRNSYLAILHIENNYSSKWRKNWTCFNGYDSLCYTETTSPERPQHVVQATAQGLECLCRNFPRLVCRREIIHSRSRRFAAGKQCWRFVLRVSPVESVRSHCFLMALVLWTEQIYEPFLRAGVVVLV